ncbi:MAG: S1 RNA-binding domain-containing protein [Patescibacteria group bacterium]
MLVTLETDKKNTVMEELLKSKSRAFLKLGELVEGAVLQKRGTNLFLDLGDRGMGIVFGREFQNAKDIIKKLKIGDLISVKVVDLENENGLVEFSIKEAGSDVLWKEAAALKESQDALELKVTDSNKGGLVIEWKGVKGFLPASQLSSAHYPKVEGGDKEKISEELKKLIGQTLSLIVLDVSPKEEKLIFSEKGIISEDVKKIVEKYKVGDVIEGEITGVVEFGVFIKLEEGLEGLAHISELDWALVENPASIFKAGEIKKAKIIAIDGDKVSLSIKALLPDPWIVGKDKHKKGDIVEGKILRINKFGALILLDSGIYGLSHISEFETERKMRDSVKVGENYLFQIAVFQPEQKKLSLSFLGKDGQPKKSSEEEKK